MPVLTRRQAQVLRPRYDLTNGLVGWFALSQVTDLDISGYGTRFSNTSATRPTIVPGFVADPDGKRGALKFASASSTYINTGRVTRYELSNNFTYSAWVFVSSYALGCISNYDTGTAGNNGAFTIYTSSAGKIIVEAQNGSTSVGSVTGTNAIPLNAWNHVAVTISSTGALTIYINGAVDKSASFGSCSGWVSTSVGLTLGVVYVYSGGGTKSNYFTGQIDDFRIYNRALSPGEIQSLYASEFMPTDAMLDSYPYLPPTSNNPRFINFPMLGM